MSRHRRLDTAAIKADALADMGVEYSRGDERQTVALIEMLEEAEGESLRLGLERARDIVLAQPTTELPVDHKWVSVIEREPFLVRLDAELAALAQKPEEVGWCPTCHRHTEGLS